MWKDSCAMFGSAIRQPSNSPYIQLSGMAFLSPGSDVKFWGFFLLLRYVVTWIRSFQREKDPYKFLTGWEMSKYNNLGFSRKCLLNNLCAAWLIPLCWHEVLERKRWSLGLAHYTLNSYSRGHLCIYCLGCYFSISKISKDPSTLKATFFSSGQTTSKDLHAAWLMFGVLVWYKLNEVKLVGCFPRKSFYLVPSVRVDFHLWICTPGAGGAYLESEADPSIAGSTFCLANERFLVTRYPQLPWCGLQPSWR